MLLFLENMMLKKRIKKAFKDAGLTKKYKESLIYPTIHAIQRSANQVKVTFTIPNGVDPESVISGEKYFKQNLGTKQLSVTGEIKKFVLKIHLEKPFQPYKYQWDEIAPILLGKEMPIVCGKNDDGEYFVYDLLDPLTPSPHLIIAGETGSGKSSQVRSVVTTLFKYKKPTQLHAYLCDPKRSEFHIFKNCKHVKGYAKTGSALIPILHKVCAEMENRGDLLEKYGVEDIKAYNKLGKKKKPYILVCVDEVALLKKDATVMEMIEEISTVGRALGVFLILSMQRPDAKVLDGKLKVNCTVRMGFKTEELINSKIMGTPGSEKIEHVGQFYLRRGKMTLLQAPHLELNKAKELLKDLLEVKKEEETSTTEKQAPMFGVIIDE